jgi:LPXTG-site transpeptidase (sortase) family protein
MSIQRHALRRPSVHRAVFACLAAVLVLGTFAAASPAGAASIVYKPVAGLAGPTRVDRIVVTRVGIDLPIKYGVVPIRYVSPHIAYHYPGTSWPGGHLNTYLYGHARAGAFLKLRSMKKGDIVLLHLVTGGWVRYRVTIIRQVRWNDGKWALLGKGERLTLQTCVSYRPHGDKFVVVGVPVA